jgi:hypothetical protein
MAAAPDGLQPGQLNVLVRGHQIISRRGSFDSRAASQSDTNVWRAGQPILLDPLPIYRARKSRAPSKRADVYVDCRFQSGWHLRKN